MKTREHSRSVVSRGASILILLLFAGPALAEIDFSPLPVAFIENMSGESASPSTPELDLLGTSGLELVNGTYTGNAAHLMVDHTSTLFSFGQIDVSSATYGSDHGFRAEFENLTLSEDGTANLFINALMPTVGPGTESHIWTALYVTPGPGAGAGDVATLYIEEANANDPLDPLASSSIDLTSAEATAILSGAHVRLDMLIRDSSHNVSVESRSTVFTLRKEAL